jgi:hypothetical protein
VKGRELRIRDVDADTMARLEAFATSRNITLTALAKLALAQYATSLPSPTSVPQVSTRSPLRVHSASTDCPPGGVRGGVSKRLEEGLQEELEVGIVGGKNGRNGQGTGPVGVPPASTVCPDPREWARPYYEPWVARFGGQPNVGLLRKQVEPLERADGRERTVARWGHFVAGLQPRFFPAKGDPFRASVLRFAGAPAAYDDEDWHLSAAERAADAKLLEGL